LFSTFYNFIGFILVSNVLFDKFFSTNK